MRAKAHLEYIYPTPWYSMIHMVLLLLCSFKSFYMRYKGLWVQLCFSHCGEATVTSRINVKKNIKLKVGTGWEFRGLGGSSFLKGNYPITSTYAERSGPLKWSTKTKAINRNSVSFDTHLRHHQVNHVDVRIVQYFPM